MASETYESYYADKRAATSSTAASSAMNAIRESDESGASSRKRPRASSATSEDIRKMTAEIHSVVEEMKDLVGLPGLVADLVEHVNQLEVKVAALEAREKERRRSSNLTLNAIRESHQKLKRSFLTMSADLKELCERVDRSR